MSDGKDKKGHSWKEYAVALVIAVVLVVAWNSFSSGSSGDVGVDEKTLVVITSEKFDIVPKGTPLYDAEMSATIEMDGGNKTYFVADSAYLQLLKYFGTGGTDKPFKAVVVQKKVLYNDNASVITEVFDMNGKALDY